VIDNGDVTAPIGSSVQVVPLKEYAYRVTASPPLAPAVKAMLRLDVVAVIVEIVGANGTTLVIPNDRVTLVAARWFALSATDATSVHVPA